MSRLRMMRSYLCGPMDHDRESGKEWRVMMTEWLASLGVIVFDPYHKPMASVSRSAVEDDVNFQIVKDALERGDRDLAAKRMKPVRAVDLRMVDHSDFLVVNLDLTKNPCGTYEEIFWANRAKRPIITMCPQGVNKISPWLFGTYPHETMFDKWEDVKNYLSFVNSCRDEEIDTLGRWIFFDVESQIRDILKLDNGVKNDTSL